MLSLPLEDQEEVSYTEPGLSLTETGEVPVSKQTADRRARDYSFATNSPVTPDQLLSGDEPYIRQTAAFQKNAETKQKTFDMMNTLARRGNPTPEEVETLRAVRGKKPYSPDTVMEEGYGEKLTEEIVRDKGINRANIYKRQRDEELATRLSGGVKITQRLVEETEERAKKEGWGSYLLDVGQSLIPFLSWYRTINVTGGPTVSWLPGSNQEEQFMWIKGLPLDQQYPTAKRAIDDLASKNMLDAVQFAKGLHAYSTNQRLLDNMVGLVDVAGTFPYRTTGKLISGAVRAAERAFTKDGPATVAEAQKLIGQEERKLLTYNPDKEAAVTPPPQERKLLEYDPILPSLSEMRRAPYDLTGSKPPPGTGPVIDLPMPPAPLPSLEALRNVPQNIPSLNELRAGKSTPKTGLPASADEEAIMIPKFLGRPLKQRTESEVSEKIAMQDAAKAASKETVEEAREVMGDIPGSAKVAVEKEVQRRVENNDPTGSTRDLFSILPSFMNPTRIFNYGSNKASEYGERILRDLERNIGMMMTALGKTGIFVERLSVPALQEAYKRAEHSVRGQYRHLNDSILDIVHNPMDANTSVYTVSMHLGKPDATLFETYDLASNYRQLYGIDAAEGFIRPQGTKWYIDVPKAIDETKGTVREQLTVDTKNQTPINMANTFVGWLMSSRSLVSELAAANRNIATTVPQELQRFMIEVAKPLGNLTRTEGKNLQKILTQNRDMINPLDPTQRGWFYQTQGELDNAFISTFGRNPTSRESAAYWTAIQVNDYDWVLRNLNLYRDWSRQGVEDIRVGIRNAAGSVEKTAYFKGRTVDDIPWDEKGVEDHILYIMENGLAFRYNKNDIPGTGTVGREIRDKIKSGWNVIQVAEITKHPLKDATSWNDTFTYIVTKDYDRRILPYKQIDYRPGGHVIYPNPWWVKQAVLATITGGRKGYYGDSTIFNFRTQAEARKYAANVETARRMFNEGNPNFDTFVSANLPFTPTEVRQKFHAGIWDKDSPFAPVFANRSIYDDNPVLKEQVGDIVDYTKSKRNLAANIDKAFLGERDPIAFTVREGARLHLEDAKQLDPFAAMQKGMSTVIRNRWMNDYKTAAIESFVQEFGDLAKMDKADLVRNPLAALYNRDIFKVANPEDRDALAAAKNAQRSIVNFLGQQSELGLNLSSIENKLMNYIYGKYGQKGVNKVPEYLLEAVRDPATYARSIAFDTKLGLWNPIQLLVQSQAAHHAMAVAGKEGLNGFYGAGLGTLLRRTEDPGVIAHFDRLAQKWGWKTGEFKESIDLFKRTGFYNVGGETAMRDSVFDPTLWTGTRSGVYHPKTYLEKGRFFFKEGERFVRQVAWHSSFKEWRKANPYKEITNRDIGDILRRADDLSLNMTRASNAAWQQGFLSIPTQFLTFNARLAEQLLGKRISAAERTRALTMYASLYGVPSAGGAAIAIYPLYDDMRTAALNQGLDMDNFFNKLFLEGGYGTLLSAVAGNYNVAQRLGPGNNRLLKEMVSGDKSFAEIVFGASGAIMNDIIGTGSPFLRHVKGYFTDEFPLTGSDFTDILRQVSSYEWFNKTYTAAVLGRYVTKKDVPLDEVNNMDTFMIAMGLTPLKITDSFLMGQSTKALKEHQDGVQKEITREMTAALNAMTQKDFERWNKHMTRIQALLVVGDFRPDQFSDVFRRSINNEDAADRSERIFNENAPYSQWFKRREQNLFNKGQ